MSWNSLRIEGSGLIISSKGKDPSHLSLKSRGSGFCERVSDVGWMVSGFRFTYVVMLNESTQRQSVGLVVVMVEVTGLIMGQSDFDEVR